MVWYRMFLFGFIGAGLVKARIQYALNGLSDLLCSGASFQLIGFYHHRHHHHHYYCYHYYYLFIVITQNKYKYENHKNKKYILQFKIYDCMKNKKIKQTNKIN